MLDNWSRPLVIGHRGACAHAPENTLASFQLAIDQGADGIEFDVKLSKDRHVVVMHDASIDRTTTGIGLVNQFNLNELKTFDAGVKFGDRYPGEKIPTLEEVLDLFGKKTLMNIELTNYSSRNDRLVEEVVNVVKKMKVEKNILFSSFLPGNLNTALKIKPEIPCGLLTSAGWKGYVIRKLFWRDRYQALHPKLIEVSKKLVNEFHRAGKRIHVWTVNEEADYKKMLDLGVDGIITDDPGLLRKMV